MADSGKDYDDLIQVIERQALIIDTLLARVNELEANVDRVVPYNALRTKLEGNADKLYKASQEVERVYKRLSEMSGPDPASFILPRGTEVYPCVFMLNQDDLQHHERAWLIESGYEVSHVISNVQVVMKNDSSDVADIDHVSFRTREIDVRQQDPCPDMVPIWNLIIEHGQRTIQEINDPRCVKPQTIAKYSMESTGHLVHGLVFVSKNPFESRPNKRKRRK